MANWASHLMKDTDSRSLWNYTLSPGWDESEVSILRLAVMKYGVGKWQDIRKHLPAKTVAQLNLQTQRLFGQQSLGEFADLNIDPRKIWEVNNAKTGDDVKRKNGCVVNTGGEHCFVLQFGWLRAMGRCRWVYLYNICVLCCL